MFPYDGLKAGRCADSEQIVYWCDLSKGRKFIHIHLIPVAGDTKFYESLKNSLINAMNVSPQTGLFKAQQPISQRSISVHFV